MRRSILIVAVTLHAVAMTACTKENAPTGPVPLDREASVDFRPVKDLKRLTQISAGAYHSCALRASGRLWCWGRDNDGQIGGGTPTTLCSSGLLCFPLPREVAVDTSGFFPCCFNGIRAVAAGENHSCAIASAAMAWCWGSNANYKLGNSGPSRQFRPVPVPGSFPYEYIAVNGASTCAISGGYVYCLGQNGPAFVPGSIYDSFYALSMGDKQSCMMGSPAQGGRPFCWGANSNGQSGSNPGVAGATVAPFGTTQIGFGAASRVSAGAGFTCADMTDGTVGCFGSNTLGQFGNPNFRGSYSFTPVPVDGGRRLHGVSAGEHHACAIDDTNAAWCWGVNSYGELGVPPGGGISNPFVVVSPVLVGGGHAFFSISSGRYHTCGIGTDGLVWCWGDNGDGQLGTNQALPGQSAFIPVQALVPGG